MRKVLEKAEIAAKAPHCKVLITGETGVGKEWMAELIHNWNIVQGTRPRFVNCSLGSIPETLFASELFGSEDGGYTGARKRAGFIEEAGNGTLFLDEIGTMNACMQAMLLQFLQKKIIYRIGSAKEIQADPRVISATNLDIEKAVEDGSFRSDLYYRLNVVRIKMPALRERRDDIPRIAGDIINSLYRTYGWALPEVSPEVMEVLAECEWPGNIRQLQHILEVAVVKTGGSQLKVNHLELDSSVYMTARQSSAVLPGIDRSIVTVPMKGITIDEVEREMIKQTMLITDCNKTRAAEMLGISLKTLHNKLNIMRESDGSIPAETPRFWPQRHPRNRTPALMSA